MGLKAKVQGLVFPKHEESLSNGVHSSASLFSLNLNVHSPSHWELVVEASVLLLVAAGSGANFCLLSLESDNARSSWFFEEKELSAQLSFPAFIFFLSITPVHLHSFKSPSCNCCWSWLDDGLQCCFVYEVSLVVLVSRQTSLNNCQSFVHLFVYSCSGADTFSRNMLADGLYSW